MTRIEHLAAQIAELPNEERRQLFRLVLPNSDPTSSRIIRDPRVCGGDACIVRTRIPVWLLVQARNLGSGESEILAAYPALHAEDLEHAWAYALAHPQEIESQIRHHEAA